jgi:SAM-dependent methyltransferase
VLDLACGPGHVAAAAAARGASAAGLDFSSAMVAVAQAAYPAVDFAQGDVEALPYPDHSFDAVVANFGMHHFPRPAAALDEIARVLEPGGRVAFTTWAQPEDNVAWRLVFDAVMRHGDVNAAKSPPPGGSINTPDACRDALAQAGFDEPQVELLRRAWPLRSARDLLDALAQGTARMAALLAAQSPAAMPAIEADIARQAASYRDADWLRIPTAALLARGRKPS